MHAGARVIGLASPENLDWLKRRGIVAVAYGDGQEERILAANGNKRPDALIDTVGAGYVDLALSLGLSTERINTVVDFKAAQEKGVKAMGTKQAAGLPALQELANLAESGVISIPIAEALPLDRVQGAYRKVVERTTRGKIVLHPQE